MLRWCYNQLSVINPSSDFMDFMSGGLNFNKIIPCPKNCFSDLDWCVDNWGTKWNVAPDNNTDFSEGDTINFNTFLNPPIPVIKALATKFPNLKFTLRYFEASCFFGGIVEFSNGDITLDEEFEEDDLEHFCKEFFDVEFGYPDHDDSDLLDFLEDDDFLEEDDD